jgi:hypothetical protein
MNDPKWRASLAGALHRYCESVMVQVPRNTPQEDQWVDNESADIGAMPMPPISSPSWEEAEKRRNARSRRLFGSPESARKALRYGLGKCLEQTKKLTASSGTAAETCCGSNYHAPF